MLSLTILSSGLPLTWEASKTFTIVTDHLHFLPQGILRHISDQKALVSLLKIPLHIHITPSPIPMRFLKFLIVRTFY